MGLADLSFTVDCVGDPAARAKHRQQIDLTKTACFEKRLQGFVWSETWNPGSSLLVVVNQSRQQTAQGFLFSCSSLAHVNERLHQLGGAL